MRVFPCCVRELSLHLVGVREIMCLLETKGSSCKRASPLHLVGVCVWDADEPIHPCILLYVQLHI